MTYISIYLPYTSILNFLYSFWYEKIPGKCESDSRSFEQLG